MTKFPEGFCWGVATAAYQIEGAHAADGKGPSIWDTFTRLPGRIVRGDNGDVACDSYHRVDDDLDLLGFLGVNAYRFSVSWPRVQPDGRGKVNEAGLAYYERLIDSLLEREITPFLTLYHWDLPEPLQDAGGWPARDVAGRFADYASLMAERFGDRVAYWTTVNEPHVIQGHGYRWGEHAPGITDGAQARAATHHLLLAHGLAVRALHARLPGGIRPGVGIVLNLFPVRPADQQSAADRDLAARIDAEMNGLFLDPLFSGRYPENLEAEFRPDAHLVRPGDLEIIHTPIDFLGINYYQPRVVRVRTDGIPLVREVPIRDRQDAWDVFPEEFPRTPMGWMTDPEGLFELLVRLQAMAPDLPLYITENGTAADDYVDPNGRIKDEERVAYLEAHLRAAGQALAAGVHLRGYFFWSLLDNFEWAWGYSKRFGLVFVDFGTGRRIPKASAYRYREIIRAGGL